MSNTLFNYYKKHGFVLIRNFFDSNDKSIIANVANRLYNSPDLKGNENSSCRKYYENTINGNRILSRMEKVCKVHSKFNKYINPKVNSVLNNYEGKNMVLFKDKLNWKLPGGGAFRPHQDFQAWSDFPPKYYVSCAIFIDECTIDNGCLEMAEDNRHEGLIKYNETDRCLESDLTDKMNWVPILAKPDDLVIFDAFVPHRSGVNNTNHSRGVFYLTYNESKYGDFYEEYFKRKWHEFPPDIDRTDNTELDLNSKYNFANPIS